MNVNSRGNVRDGLGFKGILPSFEIANVFVSWGHSTTRSQGYPNCLKLREYDIRQRTPHMSWCVATQCTIKDRVIPVNLRTSHLLSKHFWRVEVSVHRIIAVFCCPLPSMGEFRWCVTSPSPSWQCLWCHLHGCGQPITTTRAVAKLIWIPDLHYQTRVIFKDCPVVLKRSITEIQVKIVLFIYKQE